MQKISLIMIQKINAKYNQNIYYPQVWVIWHLSTMYKRLLINISRVFIFNFFLCFIKIDFVEFHLWTPPGFFFLIYSLVHSMWPKDYLGLYRPSSGACQDANWCNRDGRRWDKKKNWNALEKLNKNLTNLDKNLVSLKIS